MHRHFGLIHQCILLKMLKFFRRWCCCCRPAKQKRVSVTSLVKAKPRTLSKIINECFPDLIMTLKPTYRDIDCIIELRDHIGPLQTGYVVENHITKLITTKKPYDEEDNENAGVIGFCRTLVRTLPYDKYATQRNMSYVYGNTKIVGRPDLSSPQYVADIKCTKEFEPASLAQVLLYAAIRAHNKKKTKSVIIVDVLRARIVEWNVSKYQKSAYTKFIRKLLTAKSKQS